MRRVKFFLFCFFSFARRTSNFALKTQIDVEHQLVFCFSSEHFCYSVFGLKGCKVESVWVECVLWRYSDNSHDYLFIHSWSSVQARFLLPRSAKQHVDVCCISIKHSLFQRVHLLPLSVFICLFKRISN